MTDYNKTYIKQNRILLNNPFKTKCPVSVSSNNNNLIINPCQAANKKLHNNKCEPQANSLTDVVVLDCIILTLYYYSGAGRDEVCTGYHGVAVHHRLLCC